MAQLMVYNSASWEAEDTEPEQASMDNASNFLSIPYPLPEHLHQLHDAYETGELSLPDTLVPGYKDPIFSGWVASRSILSTSFLLQELLRWTRWPLDNKHLFTYGLFFKYLHLMIEGKEYPS